MRIRIDKETKIKHLVAENNGEETLCGIGYGWTMPDKKPVKQKYGTTCVECQEVVRDVKELKLKHYPLREIKR